ncbi:MAG: hypothetical protein ACRC0N_06525 [Acinetobacter johnsonii]
MKKYLKMSDVFDVQPIRLPASWSYEMVAHAVHAIDSHDELVVMNKELLAAIAEIDGCFEAALIEGWIEAVSGEDISRIKDIYCRRIDYARSIALAVLSGGSV